MDRLLNVCRNSIMHLFPLILPHFLKRHTINMLSHLLVFLNIIIEYPQYFQSLYVENFSIRPSIWDEVSNLFLICRQPSRGTFCQSSYSHHSITQTIKIYCLFCQEPKNQPNRMIKFIGSVMVCWIIKIRLMKISLNSSFIYFHSAFKTAILDADEASV